MDGIADSEGDKNNYRRVEDVWEKLAAVRSSSNKVCGESPTQSPRAFSLRLELGISQAFDICDEIELLGQCSYQLHTEWKQMQLLKGRTRPGKAESIAVSVVSSSSRTIADCHERATRPRITAFRDPLIRIHAPGIDTEWNKPIKKAL
ncbi:hypothetical protein TcasGA2_TC011904 [Tribolium castaneum]|uniref:Uncharacterized protein n=1 Tax=Tribolium castaneum TaxID=7070 RepID=D6X3E0_TRICA|nr:hypothetical protein TcasGA2_TC011904 [Tribolium castaneum]